MSSNTLLETTSTDFSYKVSTDEKDFKLQAIDRCDRCGAQAYIEVTLDKGAKLLFCGHHYKAQESVLLPLPAVLSIRDESAKLHWKPPVELDD